MTSQEADTQFTVVYSCFEVWKAHLAQHALEREGIESFIDDANIVTMNWLYANAVGGVRLRVRGRDAARAGHIIQAMEEADAGHDLELADGAEPSGPTGCERGTDQAVQPGEKGKRKTFITRYGLAAIGSWLVLGIPLFFRRARDQVRRRLGDESENAQSPPGKSPSRDQR